MKVAGFGNEPLVHAVLYICLVNYRVCTNDEDSSD